jgi:hypothetical protein
MQIEIVAAPVHCTALNNEKLRLNPTDNVAGRLRK